MSSDLRLRRQRHHSVQRRPRFAFHVATRPRGTHRPGHHARRAREFHLRADLGAAARRVGRREAETRHRVLRKDTVGCTAGTYPNPEGVFGNVGESVEGHGPAKDVVAAGRRQRDVRLTGQVADDLRGDTRERGQVDGGLCGLGEGRGVTGEGEFDAGREDLVDDGEVEGTDALVGESHVELTEGRLVTGELGLMAAAAGELRGGGFEVLPGEKREGGWGVEEEGGAGVWGSILLVVG